MRQYIKRYRTKQCYSSHQYQPYMIDPHGLNTVYSVYGGSIIRANLRRRLNSE